MKFQIGDTVLVLHSNEEGEIVDIINSKMVMVEIRGVSFPAYIDQLDFPYFKRFTEKKVPQKQKVYVEDIRSEKKQAVSQVSDGVWLSFLPVWSQDEFGDEFVETLKIHLVNRLESGLNFDY